MLVYFRQCLPCSASASLATRMKHGLDRSVPSPARIKCIFGFATAACTLAGCSDELPCYHHSCHQSSGQLPPCRLHRQRRRPNADHRQARQRRMRYWDRKAADGETGRHPLSRLSKLESSFVNGESCQLPVLYCSGVDVVHR